MTEITKDDVKHGSEAFIADNTNRIERLEEKIRIKDQQIQQLTQRIKQLEKSGAEDRPVVVHREGEEELESMTFQEARDRIARLEEAATAEDRKDERVKLTKKQEVLYSFALYNPDASRRELLANSPFNRGNMMKALRQILEKQWQLPDTFLEKHGLEDYRP